MHGESLDQGRRVGGVRVREDNKYNLFLAACEQGDLDGVNLLLQYHGVDPSVDNSYGLFAASASGHLNVVESLLKCNGVDPTARDNKAFRFACGNGYLDVVERLLQCKAVDLTALDNAGLLWACRRGHFDVVERLLKTDVVHPTMRNIDMAVFNGCSRVLNLLCAQDVRLWIYLGTKNKKTKRFWRELLKQRIDMGCTLNRLVNRNRHNVLSHLPANTLVEICWMAKGYECISRNRSDYSVAHTAFQRMMRPSSRFT